MAKKKARRWIEFQNGSRIEFVGDPVTGEAFRGLELEWGPEAPIHVLPIRDAREHVERADCWCEPAVEWEDGWAAKVVIHAALDGRA